MPEIPDVVPGELIEAAWGNPVRSRTLQRYVDRTGRDASVPLPGTGELSWVDDPGTIDIFDGTAWVRLDEVIGGPFLPLAGTAVSGPITGRVDTNNLIAITKTYQNLILADLTGSTAPPNYWDIRHNSGASSEPRLDVRHSTDEAAWVQLLALRPDTLIPPNGTQPGTSVSIGPTAGAPSFLTQGGIAVLNADPVNDKLADVLMGSTNADDATALYFRSYNAAGTSILGRGSLEYGGSSLGMRYAVRSTITGTAVQQAVWKDYSGSTDLGSSPRELGATALAQAANLEPGAAVLLSTAGEVSALRSVTPMVGTYAAGYLEPTDVRAGVAHPMIVADDLEALAPSMVDVFADGSKQINEQVFDAALLALVQEIDSRVTALESP